MSPFADHIPKAVPSFFKSKFKFIMVKRVGQAGNWQKPKIRRLKPGSTEFSKTEFLTCSLKITEMRGIRL